MVMDSSKTVEGLMQGIDSLAEGVDWDKDKPKGVIVFAYNDGDVMCNAYGQRASVISAIVSMMICEKDIGEVVCSAYKAYVSFTAKKFAKVYCPLIKQMDKMFREHREAKDMSVSELTECVFSDKLKPKS